MLKRTLPPIGESGGELRHQNTSEASFSP
jgi:hypothetical protein